MQIFTGGYQTMKKKNKLLNKLKNNIILLKSILKILKEINMDFKQLKLVLYYKLIYKLMFIINFGCGVIFLKKLRIHPVNIMNLIH